MFQKKKKPGCRIIKIDSSCRLNKLEGNQTYGFQNVFVFSFFVLYCVCQYIDDMYITNTFCQYFTNIL